MRCNRRGERGEPSEEDIVELLLLSTGGRPFLAHAGDELAAFFAGCRRIGFVTAADIDDERAYFARAREAFSVIAPEGTMVTHVAWDARSPRIGDLDAIFVGGGNTFALVDRLDVYGLGAAIAARVREGTLRYAGASAGANIAGPNIRTTNDMPIWPGVRRSVAPNTVRVMGLDLVPFNVNPHYPDPLEPHAQHGGTTFAETRDDRIAQYLRCHDNHVVALEERTMLSIHGRRVTVAGTGSARWFVRGRRPRWIAPGEDLPESAAP